MGKFRYDIIIKKEMAKCATERSDINISIHFFLQMDFEIFRFFFFDFLFYY